MRVYMEQHPRAPLTELAHYTDTLMKIADKSTRTSGLSKYKPISSPSRFSRSSAYAVETNSDNIRNIRNSPAKEASTISTRSYENKR